MGGVVVVVGGGTCKTCNKKKKIYPFNRPAQHEKNSLPLRHEGQVAVAPWSCSRQRKILCVAIAFKERERTIGPNGQKWREKNTARLASNEKIFISVVEEAM